MQETLSLNHSTELEETKRKLKMKPLPKPIDVEKHKAPRQYPAPSHIAE